MPKCTDKPLTYISLFSSAGVGCFGFKKHGFECIATSELLPKRLKIQIYNNKCRYKTGYISGDISDESLKSKLFKEIQLWKDKHKIKEPDVIISTPPCQGMSIANHKKKDEKGRNSLVVESIKITKKVLPKFFIFENVRSFLTTKCTDTDKTDRTIGEAIKLSLSGEYNILSEVINFKDYGSNSSRTRALVIGIRKDIENASPYDILPKKRKPKTLRNIISDLPELKKMGTISDDIFHSYREFDTNMLPWIKNLKEGQSAFENTDKKKIPHRIINGKTTFNKSKNGDKYARWHWDREGPCIHTRNDILASQNTIHPRDDRVFSIRELMRMMTIPKSFEWSYIKEKNLSALSTKEKKEFLKKEELNIRHCIGEAVPTVIFQTIASNIKKTLNKKKITNSEIKNLVEQYELYKTQSLKKFIEEKYIKYSKENLFLIAEHSNSKRQDTSAYFTRQDIVYSVIKNLPEFKTKKKIKILEPSVGVGNFIPLLFKKYREKDVVELDVCDIDKESIEILKVFLSKISVPKNFKIKFINEDFLEDGIFSTTFQKYDLVVGNPPYKKIVGNKKQLERYKANAYNKETNNLFSFFIEKSIRIADYVSLIVPKSLLSSPEFNKTRAYIKKNNLTKICDYGEKGFKGVKIETISFLLSTKKINVNKSIDIESWINNSYVNQKKSYVLSEKFPYWLIYRNKEFDEVASKMKLGVFQSFRDRQITKECVLDKGKYKVLKARNIGSNTIKEENCKFCYINDPENYAVSKYLNKNNVVMIPNLTYYPRATFLPKNTITDGSVALLTLKNGNRLPKKRDLEFYSTKEFEEYYKTARNYGTRSLNIDNNSVYFFGLLGKI